jgi:hypothetical protein
MSSSLSYSGIRSGKPLSAMPMNLVNQENKKQNNFCLRLKYFFKILKDKNISKENIQNIEKHIEIENSKNEILLPHEHIPNFLNYIRFDNLKFDPSANLNNKFIIYENEKTDNDIDLKKLAYSSKFYEYVMFYYQGVDDSGNLIVSADPSCTILNREIFFTISVRLYIRLLAEKYIENITLKNRIRKELKYKTLNEVEESNKILLQKLKNSEYSNYIEDFKNSINMIKNNEY